MRFVMEQEAQAGQFVGVPTYGLGDGIIPEGPYPAFTVPELRDLHVLGAFPAVGKCLADVQVLDVGNSNDADVGRVLPGKPNFQTWMPHQFQPSGC